MTDTTKIGLKETGCITGYHAHVYFDADTVEQALVLCQRAAEIFGVKMGRVHDKLVGPHPMWSCQLAADPEQFAQLLPWLALNRDGLIVFAHPETGDELADHRDHGIWLGTGLELDLSLFA
ncbi:MULTISPECIES: DOPA 4,5-dioxygenase family protein [Rhodobacterales]|uniref:DOPA 4,5-dioxygenase family protein n=1 Tax=Phaeobacter gallaeciensis TaxID=60890 RepID=A0ABD4X625_9RHOB|nr:DOPA 4,5-dioxygenase family protein [Phaeobacter gallaeciensis]MDF1771251.1 DOPA 4,5-dioxygenase family protein [Pseudophaeobacter sp. bin_em_oilr2.035]MDE4143819.1 DOPA 4,5-dioxygenase family protein [Phaeobacter gallaeciensis]MDE4155819.1 DOPA 4,5-dioxygenase family protein [Phaeobacter gallaeciensis]MDE4160007.1 DOPA 4,5-dioxygenase family protein [Phaeobacter gallaeciensis]MDE4164899.1 DOPA 4,5-dioxygenase family protein [Phaeobacter gallaeciensis]